jgi:ribosomal protein S27AE
MRVRCINSKPHGLYHVDDDKVKPNAHRDLKLGFIYEVKNNDGDEYQLVGVPWSWSYKRFVIIPDDACPQCGERHP